MSPRPQNDSVPKQPDPVAEEYLWFRLFTSQQELISLHRRIEALDQNLGVAIALASAFVFYGLEHHHDWKPWQGLAVGTGAAALVLLLLTLTMVGNQATEWLKPKTFESGMQASPEAQLRTTTKASWAAFQAGRYAERLKAGFLRGGLLLALAAAAGYVLVGYGIIRT